jgi:hypothetical protein
MAIGSNKKGRSVKDNTKNGVSFVAHIKSDSFVSA